MLSEDVMKGFLFVFQGIFFPLLFFFPFIYSFVLFSFQHRFPSCFLIFSSFFFPPEHLACNVCGAHNALSSRDCYSSVHAPCYHLRGLINLYTCNRHLIPKFDMVHCAVLAVHLTLFISEVSLSAAAWYPSSAFHFRRVSFFALFPGVSTFRMLQTWLVVSFRMMYANIFTKVQNWAILWVGHHERRLPSVCRHYIHLLLYSTLGKKCSCFRRVYYMSCVGDFVATRRLCVTGYVKWGRESKI